VKRRPTRAKPPETLFTPSEREEMRQFEALKRPEAIRRLLAETLGKPADVKSPALPPASDAFLRALGHTEETSEGPGMRLRKSGK
jgi:hypothetical protein